MAGYLSDDWFAALAQRLASCGLRAADDGAWAMQVRVETSGGPVDWTIVVEPQGTSVLRGDPPEELPTVRISTDQTTAIAITTGELSAQRAVMAGSLRLGGDVRLLLRNAAALDVAVGAAHAEGSRGA